MYLAFRVIESFALVVDTFPPNFLESLQHNSTLLQVKGSFEDMLCMKIRIKVQKILKIPRKKK